MTERSFLPNMYDVLENWWFRRQCNLTSIFKLLQEEHWKTELISEKFFFAYRIQGMYLKILPILLVDRYPHLHDLSICVHYHKMYGKAILITQDKHKSTIDMYNRIVLKEKKSGLEILGLRDFMKVLYDHKLPYIKLPLRKEELGLER